MANIPTFSPNPYANFSPDQWSNPYSQYQNQALPWPSSYQGWPTDAMGRPIQPTPGMTLNSAPAQAATPQAAAPGPPQAYLASAGGPQGMMGVGPMPWQGGMPDLSKIIGGAPAAPTQDMMRSWYSGNNPTNQPTTIAPPWAQSAQAQPSAPMAPPPNPGGLDAQSYLALLANPGRVQTPGATVPQAATSYQPGSGVLQQFLANWQPAQSGPGSGFQQAFNRALGR